MSNDQFNKNPQLAFRLLTDSIRAVGVKYLLFFLVLVAVAIVDLAPPQIYRYFFQNIHDQNDHVIIKFLFFGISIALCSFLATAVLIYAQEWLRCQIETYLRKTMLSSLSSTGIAKIDTIHRGEWMTSASSDLIQTEDFLAMSFPEQIKNALMFLGLCGLFWFHSGSFGLIPIGIALLLILLNVVVQRRMRPGMNEIRDLHGDVYQRLLENFEGLRTIRSFNGEEMVQKNFFLKLSNINRKSLNIMKSFALLIGSNDCAILLGITGILSLILFQLDLSKMAFADAIIYPFYMGMFFVSVSGFVRSNYDWNIFFTRGARLGNLIYCFTSPSTEKSSVDLGQNYEWQNSLPDLNDIELRYPGHELLVPLFDLSIRKNEVFGIIGPSGCGKSTLLEFLAGLRPLIVDGKNLLLPTSLTSYVEQKPYLFAGTVADNLRFGCNATVSDERIWQALAKAKLADFLSEKNGLHFQIHDRGQNLSEGQKYRLGITRAILSDKPFLLMDEPFAALDFVSIKAIIDLIDYERTRRGIVIVTHYLPSELIFDRFIDFGNLANDENIFTQEPKSKWPIEQYDDQPMLKTIKHPIDQSDAISKNI